MAPKGKGKKGQLSVPRPAYGRAADQAIRSSTSFLMTFVRVHRHRRRRRCGSGQAQTGAAAQGTHVDGQASMLRRCRPGLFNASTKRAGAVLRQQVHGTFRLELQDAAQVLAAPRPYRLAALESCDAGHDTRLNQSLVSVPTANRPPAEPTYSPLPLPAAPYPLRETEQEPTGARTVTSGRGVRQGCRRTE